MDVQWAELKYLYSKHSNWPNLQLDYHQHAYIGCSPVWQTNILGRGMPEFLLNHLDMYMYVTVLGFWRFFPTRFWWEHYHMDIQYELLDPSLIQPNICLAWGWILDWTHVMWLSERTTGLSEWVQHVSGFSEDQETHQLGDGAQWTGTQVAKRVN
jgi:hypothetical protein